MDTLKENRFLEDIASLKKSIKKGNVRLKEKVGRRIWKNYGEVSHCCKIL